MPRTLRAHFLSLFAISLMVATAAQADYNAGNDRRDQDEANRQRAAEQARRNSETATRRNEEMRSGSPYQSPAASGGYSSGSRGSSSASPSLPVPQSQPSGPQSIERTETVMLRVQETPAETAARLQREAEAGVLESQWNLGRLYNTGDLGEIRRDEAKAARWFRQAAEGGHAHAALAYGEMLLNGKGVAENPAEAGKWFRTAAEKGVPKAMFLWGTLLEIGHGTPQDFQAAFGWVKRAAEVGEINAYESLATMYRAGRGTALDVAEGLRWLRKGSEQGDARSSYELGSVYFNGNGVVKDETEAGRWFLKSAEQGHPEGMFNAGIMHEQGLLGAAVNQDAALNWYRQAAAQNSAKARTALQRLGY